MALCVLVLQLSGAGGGGGGRQASCTMCRPPCMPSLCCRTCVYAKGRSGVEFCLRVKCVSGRQFNSSDLTFVNSVAEEGAANLSVADSLEQKCAALGYCCL